MVKRLFLLCMALLIAGAPLSGAAMPDDGTIVLENPLGDSLPEDSAGAAETDSRRRTCRRTSIMRSWKHMRLQNGR